MSDTIISVENLGKRYVLGKKRQPGEGLRHALQRGLSKVWRKREEGGAEAGEEFWALRNVSFEVKKGEVLGIIGRNGAGKSTLLKILSRITHPTEGRIEIEGRVASLLEVGTGFHPELTGRENIFLNGAILGMTRREIQRKFDEIVAFAEVDQFLDTPVKRYSSGMYVRLAFSVAAHLEPEILIVDEVLAVGDAEFQRKCLGKMHDVAASHGRTVLFVSHNMAAVQHLCSTGLLLERGACSPKTTMMETIQRYLGGIRQKTDSRMTFRGSAPQSAEVFLHAPDSDEKLQTLVFDQSYALSIVLRGSLGGERVAPVIKFYDESGILISSVCGPEEGMDFVAVVDGCRFAVDLGRITLLPGSYHFTVVFYGLGAEPVLEMAEPYYFQVEAAMVEGAFRAYRPDHGIVRLARGVTAQPLS